MPSLTPAQRKVLERLADGPVDEAVDPLDGRIVPSLARRGLAQRMQYGQFPTWRFYWHITVAGRKALEEG